MKIATTGTMAPGEFLVYHGPYEVIIPKIAVVRETGSRIKCKRLQKVLALFWEMLYS